MGANPQILGDHCQMRAIDTDMNLTLGRYVCCVTVYQDDKRNEIWYEIMKG